MGLFALAGEDIKNVLSPQSLFSLVHVCFCASVAARSAQRPEHVNYRYSIFFRFSVVF